MHNTSKCSANWLYNPSHIKGVCVYVCVCVCVCVCVGECVCVCVWGRNTDKPPGANPPAGGVGTPMHTFSRGCSHTHTQTHTHTHSTPRPPLPPPPPLPHQRSLPPPPAHTTHS